MNRPSFDEYFLQIAEIVATRSTCLRRQVGCVVINKRKHIMSTGYNGPPSKFKHCSETIINSEGELDFPFACDSAFSDSGENLDTCLAVHAEQNALLQCQNVWRISTIYTTVSPCITCAKLILNTSCTRILFREHYSHRDEVLELLNDRNIELICIPESNVI